MPIAFRSAPVVPRPVLARPSFAPLVAALSLPALLAACPRARVDVRPAPEVASASTRAQPVDLDVVTAPIPAFAAPLGPEASARRVPVGKYGGASKAHDEYAMRAGYLDARVEVRASLSIEPDGRALACLATRWSRWWARTEYAKAGPAMEAHADGGALLGASGRWAHAADGALVVTLDRSRRDQCPYAPAEGDAGVGVAPLVLRCMLLSPVGARRDPAVVCAPKGEPPKELALAFLDVVKGSSERWLVLAGDSHGLERSRSVTLAGDYDALGHATFELRRRMGEFDPKQWREGEAHPPDGW